MPGGSGAEQKSSGARCDIDIYSRASITAPRALFKAAGLSPVVLSGIFFYLLFSPQFQHLASSHPAVISPLAPLNHS